jgi:hypothetical protein
MTMIAVTVAAIGLFVGWTLGLSAHALCGTRWKDPGARLAGGFGAVTIVFAGLLFGGIGIVVGAVVFDLSALISSAIFIGGAPIGGAAGWWAGERIAQISTEDAAPDDPRTTYRHETPRGANCGPPERPSSACRGP